MTTLAKLRERVWRINEEKGWHERPRTWAEIRMLVVSELAEALEEFRNGRMESYYLGDDGKPVTVGFIPPGRKPEGFPIEIADAAIRLLDWAETRGLTWDDDDEKIVMGGNIDFPVTGGVPEDLDQVVAVLHDGGSYDDDALAWLGLTACFAVAWRHDFSLLKAIQIKVEYNATRPYRHGGKAA